MDLLLRGGTVFSVDKERTVFNGDVLVRDGRIAALGPKLSDQIVAPCQVLDVSGMAVLPGFVQSHVHVGHSLFQGLVDDGGLQRFKSDKIWQLEAVMSPEMLQSAARLGMASLLLSGTTTILDVGMVRHVESLFEAGKEMGMRLATGKITVEALPPVLKENVRSALAEAERLRKVWNGAAGGRLRYIYVPYDTLSCSEEMLVELIGRARAHGCLLHCKAAETSQEVEQVRARFGADTVTHLHEVGLTGRDVILAHCVCLTAREQKLLRESQTRVSHCPVSNLRSGAGMAKLPELLSQGVHVSLGTDSAAAAGTLDVLESLRVAALVQRSRAGIGALSLHQLLEMATIRGAEALHLDEEIGSLEVGKRADMVMIDLNGVHSRAAPDVLSTLIYSCRSSDVRHVMVDGEFLVRDRVLVPIDLDVICEDADRAVAVLHHKNV